LLHSRHDPGSTGCLLFPKRDIPGDLGDVPDVLEVDMDSGRLLMSSALMRHPADVIHLIILFDPGQ